MAFCFVTKSIFVTPEVVHRNSEQSTFVNPSAARSSLVGTHRCFCRSSRWYLARTGANIVREDRSHEFLVGKLL